MCDLYLKAMRPHGCQYSRFAGSPLCRFAASQLEIRTEAATHRWLQQGLNIVMTGLQPRQLLGTYFHSAQSSKSPYINFDYSCVSKMSMWRKPAKPAGPVTAVVLSSLTRRSCFWADYHAHYMQPSFALQSHVGAMYACICVLQPFSPVSCTNVGVQYSVSSACVSIQSKESSTRSSSTA